jgi:hypothetical protein
MKGFSSLSSHLGKGKKASYLPHLHFPPNPMILFHASVYYKSFSPSLRLSSFSFLGKHSNHESITIAEISEESALGRGICTGFIVAYLYELCIVLSISEREPGKRIFGLQLREPARHLENSRLNGQSL